MTLLGSNRLNSKFAELAAQNKKAVIPFLMAGYPNYQLSLDILTDLPAHGADIIEIGMPFSDPMADGPIIQHAAHQALQNGQTLVKTLQLVTEFRAHSSSKQQRKDTPVILMGYFNPIHAYGVEKFAADAAAAGVDGLLIVDLPPDTDDELYRYAQQHSICIIRLITPTTDAHRLSIILPKASGMLYYVSITGTTGAAVPDTGKVARGLAAIKSRSELPVVVGFGIRSPETARKLSTHADGIVVGSDLVSTINAAVADGKSSVSQAVNERIEAYSRINDDSAGF